MGINFVLVHYHRTTFPSYIYDCIEQIRLFNPEADIYVAYFPSCEVDYERLHSARCLLVDIGKVPWSMAHIRFKLKNRGIFTTERFFVIYDIMRRYKLEDVIHLENDAMLYMDMRNIINVLRENYHLGFVRDSDEICIASFAYIKNAKVLNHLCKFFSKLNGVNDMVHISQYGHLNNLSYLPVVSDAYVHHEEMYSTLNGECKKVANPYI